MKKSNQLGHLNQVGNFEKLVNVVKSFGASYNPAASKMKLPQMETQFTICETTMGALMLAEKDFLTASTARNTHVKGLPKKVSTLLNHLRFCDLPAESVDDIAGIAQIIKPKNKVDKADKTATTSPEKSSSTSTEMTIYEPAAEIPKKTKRTLPGIEKKIEAMEQL